MKLIKTSKDSHHSGHYFLNDDKEFALGSTDRNWCIRAVSKIPLYVLSLKNCQTIERGYDLDLLVDEYANGKSSSDVFKEAHKKDFKEGFQKALEILHDKKFSEYEAYRIWKAGQEYWKTSGESITFEELIERRKELLQQTEWDVEFEMDEMNKPKFDDDGFIILKRL